MITWGGIAPSTTLRGIITSYLNGLTDGDPLLLHLFQNDYTPSIATLPGDLVEATFSGYAAASLAEADIGNAKLDALGNAYRLVTSLASFIQTADTITNTVYGFWITPTGSLAIVAAKRFANPIVFDHTDKAIDMEVAFQVPVGGFGIGDDTTESV